MHFPEHELEHFPPHPLHPLGSISIRGSSISQDVSIEGIVIAARIGSDALAAFLKKSLLEMMSFIFFIVVDFS